MTAMLLAGMGILSPLSALADDIPAPPGNFRAADGGDRFTFTWSKVSRTGKNGQTVNPDNVTYVLELLKDNYETDRVLLSDKAQTYTYFYPTTRGEQDIMRFSLYARNSAGKSDKVYTRVVTGTPYNLPYRESFATGTTRGLSWQEGDGMFGATTEESFDGDYGCLLCIPASDGSATSFNMGKMVMSHALNPRISFRTYGLGEGEKLIVRVARPDGQEAGVLTVKGPVDDWTLFTADLSAVKGQTFVVPKFQLADGNRNPIVIDDISISDPYTADLGVIVRPLNTAAGATSVRVFVENKGLTPASGASVSVYTGGEFTLRHSLEGIVNPGEERTVDVPVNISGDGPEEIKAEVEWIYDLNPYNDVATTQFLPDGASGNMSSGIGFVSREEPVKAKDIYTVDGRKVDPDKYGGLAPGLYIIDGKKTIIR